jgi:UDP-perosamine 4-acetyltransferase
MKLAIVGSGTYGQVYLSYLRRDSDFEVVAFLDDNEALVGTTVAGIPVLGTTADLAVHRDGGIEGVIVSIGNNRARTRILAQAKNSGLATPSFIHPKAVVSEDAQIGEGVYILPGAIVMPYAQVDDFVMISMDVNLAHHTILHQGVFLSTGVNMGAGIDVGECAFVGIGATVMTGVKSIGAHATIGAGAVVTRDVAEATTVVGVPAKPIPRL